MLPLKGIKGVQGVRGPKGNKGKRGSPVRHFFLTKTNIKGDKDAAYPTKQPEVFFVFFLITGRTRTTWNNQDRTERIKIRTKNRSDNQEEAKNQSQNKTKAANCTEL